jgi:hypothetical protein
MLAPLIFLISSSIFPYLPEVLLTSNYNDSFVCLLNLQFHAATTTLVYMSCIQLLRRRRQYCTKVATYSSLLSCLFFAVHVSKATVITNHSVDTSLGNFLSILGLYLYLKVSIEAPKKLTDALFCQIALYTVFIIQPKQSFCISIVLLADNFIMNFIVPKRSLISDGIVWLLFFLSAVSLFFRFKVRFPLASVPHELYQSTTKQLCTQFLYGSRHIQLYVCGSHEH